MKLEVSVYNNVEKPGKEVVCAWMLGSKGQLGFIFSNY